MTNETAMYGAVSRNDIKTVRRLIRQDPSLLEAFFLESSWLHRAAMLGRVKIMEVLVDAGMPVDKLTADGSETPLDAAAGQGHLQACAWLLDRGADINYGFGKAATPLFSAIFSKSLELVELFIRRGARLDATFGRPKIDVLNYALTYGTPEIVKLLESSGAKRRRN